MSELAAESVDVRLARIDEKLSAIQASLLEHDGKYVTQAEFWPVRTIVYGGAGLALLGVIGALIALVVRQPHQ